MEKIFFFVVFLCLIAIVSADIPRPRGVAISKASSYLPGQDFHCFDGSATIPFDRVNDDYCDCKDGTDEPGTAACPNGSYHCTNAGHKPLNIPSPFVNDGICDCCDGTDEYEELVQCKNTCREMGKQAREEAQRKLMLLEEGHLVFKEYCKEGKEALAEKEERLEELRASKSEAEDVKEELEIIKNDAEAPEKDAIDKHKVAWEEEKARRQEERDKQKSLEAFDELDSDDSAFVTIEEMQTHLEFDIDNSGVTSPEEAQEYLEDMDQVDEPTFLSSVWPNIKDIYKKFVPQKLEDAGTEDKDGEPELEFTTPKPREHVDNLGEEELYDEPFDEYDESRAYDEDEDDYEDDDDEDDYEEEAEEEEDKMPEYDEETKRLIEIADQARQAFNDAESKLKDIENEIKDLTKVLDLDFGDNLEFYPLKGKCFDYTDREYTYTLCPFEKATQKSKQGGSTTSLGMWGKWIGGSENKYNKMIYEKGQNCWNGPDRSATVVLDCGKENQLASASEPNRCEYKFEFHTPAACSKPPAPAPSDPDHDEL